VEPMEPWGHTERVLFSIFHAIVLQAFEDLSEEEMGAYLGLYFEHRLIEKLSRFAEMSAGKIVENFRLLMLK